MSLLFHCLNIVHCSVVNGMGYSIGKNSLMLKWKCNYGNIFIRTIYHASNIKHWVIKFIPVLCKTGLQWLLLNKNCCIMQIKNCWKTHGWHTFSYHLKKLSFQGLVAVNDVYTFDGEAVPNIVTPSTVLQSWVAAIPYKTFLQTHYKANGRFFSNKAKLVVTGKAFCWVRNEWSIFKT